MAYSLRHWLACIVLMLVHLLPLAAETIQRSPAELAYSPDGRILAVLDATARQVVLIDPVSQAILRGIRVRGTPSGLAWSSASDMMFVSESGVGRITEIRAADGQVVRSFACGRYPSGLAYAPERKLLLSADWGLNRLTVIDTTNGTTRANIPVGCQPTAVAVTRDETLAVVTALLPSGPAHAPDHAAEVTLIDLEKLEAGPSVRLPTGSTNARGVTISGDGASAFVVHTLGRFHLPTTQLDRGWVNTNALSIIDLKKGVLKATVLLDQVMDGAADPWGVAIDPQGLRLYITLSGVHQLAVIDLPGLKRITGTEPASLSNDLAALHRNGLIRRMDLPAKGPRGINVSPDGEQLAIAGYFSGNVISLDKNASMPVSIPLGPQPEPDLVRRGETAFHDASLCFQRWLSCASCHPDARADGHNWDLLNDGIGNPKNARSMLLSHRTPPMMSLGVRDRMETAVRAGFVHIQFTVPDAADVDAVSAYFKSLQPVISPHRMPDGSLTESAARGEKIFRRPAVGCADCHPAPLFTDLATSDVGTNDGRDPDGSGYDTPTLVELWRNPPYLHDGRSATLREVLIDHNKNDRHGSTSRLKPSELDDLIEYLLSL
jgi:YVTN family beta-propeller protein